MTCEVRTVNRFTGVGEYVKALVKNLAGEDITSAVITMALGERHGDDPGTYQALNFDDAPSSDTRIVGILVDDDTALGVYDLWVDIDAAPQHLRRRVGQVSVI